MLYFIVIVFLKAKVLYFIVSIFHKPKVFIISLVLWGVREGILLHFSSFFFFTLCCPLGIEQGPNEHANVKLFSPCVDCT